MSGLCRCGCGQPTKIAQYTDDRRGSVKGQPNTYIFGHTRVRHGHKRKNRATPEYKTWMSMNSRCNNPNTKEYEYYGGRGITVCTRWGVFENFLEDMGTRPSHKHSIDRINGNGNYTPENCKWSTYTEQNRNRRTVRLNTEAAKVIRYMTSKGVPQRWIGKLYGISQTMVGKISRYEVWK